MKRLGQIREEEIISEFLRAEFYNKEFARDRRQFEQIVYDPNLNDEAENSLRRALLYRRRGALWRELPKDTQWFEIDFTPDDCDRVNVFPRAQWRRVARGNFNVQFVAAKIRSQIDSANPSELILKIRALVRLMEKEGPSSTVVLIGLDEHKPVTLLEGNHRFVASLLLPREIMFRRIRIVCGFSPQMEECCWYKTSLPSLSNYLKNRIKHRIKRLWKRDDDITQWLVQIAETRPKEELAGAASAAVPQGDKVA
jgi:hypothetical protein